VPSVSADCRAAAPDTVALVVPSYTLLDGTDSVPVAVRALGLTVSVAVVVFGVPPLLSAPWIVIVNAPTGVVDAVETVRVDGNVGLEAAGAGFGLNEAVAPAG